MAKERAVGRSAGSRTVGAGGDGVAGAAARRQYMSGANCAEAVLAAVPSVIGRPDLSVSSEVGAGWAAGIGGEGCLCGALAGAVMIAGAAAVAEGGSPAAQRRLAERLSSELKGEFAAAYRSPCCRVIRKGLEPGTPECRAHCADVTATGADLVAALVAREGLGAADPADAGVKRPRPTDGSSAARSAASRLLLGLLVGTWAAWLLLGWTWLDMRANVGLAVPAGLFSGAVWAALGLRSIVRDGGAAGRTLSTRAWSRGVVPYLVGVLAAVPLVWAFMFTSGAPDVIAILWLQGFGLRRIVPIDFARAAIVATLLAALVLGVWSSFSRKGEVA